MKLLLKLCISPTQEPQGVFIGATGTGGQGQTLTRSGARAAAIQWPRARRFEPRGPVCPLSVLVPGFWFCTPGFDESAPLGQWLFM